MSTGGYYWRATEREGKRLKASRDFLPESQSQNLDLTVVCVPEALNSEEAALVSALISYDLLLLFKTLGINETYYTNALMLLVKIITCVPFHCPNILD